VWQESYKRNYKRFKIKDFVNKELKSKGQTKDFKMGRCLSRLYSKNSGLKIVYI
jgi:hypothetical protein